MEATRGRSSAHRRGPSLETALLTLSLIAGAYVAAVALATGTCRWVAWFTLVPLFVSIRVQRPVGAGLSGGLWGLSLYVFLAVAGAGTAVAPGIQSFALLTAVPAIYAFGAAYLTRWMGFSPFLLGAGWVGVEFALAPLGVRYGLLAGTQSDRWLLPVVANVLGYGFVAFLVAYVSAWLVTVLSHVRVCIPSGHRPAVSAGKSATLLCPQTFSCFPLFAIHPSRPRAPPARYNM